MNNYNKEDIQKIVKESYSFSTLYKKLGKTKPSGNMVKSMKKRLDEWGIDYSHFGKRPYNIKYKVIKKRCPNCGNSFEAQKGHPKEAKTCSHKCSNIYFSSKRMTDDTKKKISVGINRYLEKNGKITEVKHITRPLKINAKICPTCNEEFKPKKRKQKCCSKNCGYIFKHGSLPLTKNETITKILELAQSGDYQKRQASRKLISSAVRFFGTWNKAIKECGLTPNKSHFQKCRIKAKDGHMVDSLSELIIDNYLSENVISHDVHKRLPDSNLICDFYL